jgi:hypothetical protein
MGKQNEGLAVNVWEMAANPSSSLHGDLFMIGTGQYKNGLHAGPINPPAGQVANRVVALVSDGCETGSLWAVIERLRREGCVICLVGLHCGPVTGRHNCQFEVDMTLTELGEDTAVSLLLLPDGEDCTNSLLCDPRVHHLIDTVVRQQGRIMALGSSEVGLRQLLLLTRIPVQQFVSRLPGVDSLFSPGYTGY